MACQRGGILARWGQTTAIRMGVRPFLIKNLDLRKLSGASRIYYRKVLYITIYISLYVNIHGIYHIGFEWVIEWVLTGWINNYGGIGDDDRRCRMEDYDDCGWRM